MTLRKVVDNNEPPPRCPKRPEGKKCNGSVRVVKVEKITSLEFCGERHHGVCRRCKAKLVREEGWRNITRLK